MPIFPFVYGVGLGLSQDAFLATPEHRWATEGIALAKREGLFFAYPDHGWKSERPHSRYEIAVIFHAVAAKDLQELDDFNKQPRTDLSRASLLRGRAMLPYYIKADSEFKAEYRSLGVMGDCGPARIAALSKQIASTSEPRHFLFEDVPADHWAAKAVGDLRALGLLDGYPDERFRGSK